MSQERQVRNVALYGRVSTVRQAMVEEGGLDTQFEMMRRELEGLGFKRPEFEWKHFDDYREEARSGKDLHRPELERLMSDIEAGRVDAVIVAKIDRISRSIVDFEHLVSFFEKHDVAFLSVKESFDTSSAIGRAMIRLIVIFAALEREQTAERTTATMQHRATQGLWNGGFRPLGYAPDPDSNGALRIVEDEAELVRREFFERVLEVGSIGKLVDHLREQGIRTPEYESRRERKQGGGLYSKSSVQRVLTNQAYLGKIEYKGEIHEGQHDPIVDQDLFERVQALLVANQRARGNTRAVSDRCYLLSGLMRCGRCGAMMTPKPCLGRGRRAYHYYACGKQLKTRGRECSVRSLPAHAVEDRVLAELKTIPHDEGEIRRVVEEACEAAGGRQQELESERAGLARRLQEVEARLSRLLGAVEGGDQPESFLERLNELDAQRASMRERLDELDRDVARLRHETPSAEALTRSYSDFGRLVDLFLDRGEHLAVKDLVALHVEVLEWHEDESHPKAGTLKMQLWDDPDVPEEFGADLDPGQDADPVNRFVECRDWLPESTAESVRVVVPVGRRDSGRFALVAHR